MSKVIFITSEKKINLSSYGIEQIMPNDYTYSIFPCLKDKKYIYDFENFNNSVSFKEFVTKLINHVQKDNNIVFLVCEETTDKQEINLFNKNLKNRYIINLSEDKSKLYDLIYRLENNSLIASSEYSFTIDY